MNDLRAGRLDVKMYEGDPEEFKGMTAPRNRFYEFGAFRVDTKKRLLLRDEAGVPLAPKAFDTLLLLIESNGELVTKQDLMERLWPDTFVEEGSLTRNIYILRKALGDSPVNHRYIVTVPGQGYRFVSEVREVSDDEPDLRITERTRTTIVVREEQADSEAEDPPAFEPLTLAQDIKSPAPEISETSPRVQADEGVSPAAGPIPKITRRKALAVILASVLLVALALAVGLYGRLGGGRIEAGPDDPSRKLTIASLTTTGNIVSAAISPDGNYVAYAAAEKPELSSLWVMQLATFTSRPVIPPAGVQYHAITFSPDGNYIYYVMRENNTAARALYRVSSLGGPSKKLLDRVETAVSFSPDGSLIAFRRGLNDRREAALFIANADGTGERELASLSYPENLGDPSWSPDGKVIACAAGHAEGGINMYPVAVNVDEGVLRPISPQRWRWVGPVAWRSDSSALMMVASDHPSEPYQVWQVSYPGGKAERITNDHSQYNRLSISRDSSAMIALQRRLDTSVWMVPAEDPARAEQITLGMGGYRAGISWTPDGRIVYDSAVGNSTAISVMEGDGTNPRHLLGDMTGRAIVWYARVTPDGRHILYASDLSGTRHIWRMDIDGGNPVQLTNGGGEDHPSPTPDGKWVVFTSKGSDNPSLWKVPIDGGEPVRLTTDFTAFPEVSPDGKLIACLHSELDPGASYKVAVIPAEGGEPLKIFNATTPGAVPLRWTRDGRGITYGENPIGTSSVWVQPLDGGPSKKLVELGNDRVFAFDWSPDGKRLACVRGRWAANVVLIRGFK